MPNLINNRPALRSWCASLTAGMLAAALFLTKKAGLGPGRPPSKTVGESVRVGKVGGPSTRQWAQSWFSHTHN